MWRRPGCEGRSTKSMTWRAIVSAPDPVLMLDRDDVDAALDGASRVGIVARNIPTDPVMDLDGVRRCLVDGMQRDDLAIAPLPWPDRA